MHKYIIQFIFLLVVLVFCIEESAADVFLNINGATSAKNISSTEINNIKYVEFGKFIKSINPDIDISNSKNIIYSIKDLFCAKTYCNNFFVIFSRNSSNYFNSNSNNNNNNNIFEIILQLPVPVLCNSGINYIPIASFLHSLSQYIDFKYDILDNGVYIQVDSTSNFYDFFCIKQNINSSSSADENIKISVKEQKDEKIQNCETDKKIENTNGNSKPITPEKKILKIKPLEKYNIDYFDRSDYKYFIPDILIKKQLNEL